MKFVFISHGIPELAIKRIQAMLNKTVSEIKVLYVTTPQNTYSKDAPWILESRQDLEKTGFQIQEYDLEAKDEISVKENIDNSDIVWISGGNAFYFLYWAEKVNLKTILLNFLKAGGIYAGESAGVVCQIQDLEPIKWADHPEKAPVIVSEGMQLTSVVALPHWGNEKYAQIMNKIKSYYEAKGLKPYLLKDGEALIIENDKVEHLTV